MLPLALVFAIANPFFSPSTLPYQAPPFNRITDADYQPAIEAGMAQQIKEVDAIANNSAVPTFQNTYVALEKSGQLLTRVLSAFNCVTGANTDPALQNVEEVTAPKLAAHQDAIYLNPKLFARLKTVYDELPSLHLDPESQQLVRVTYAEFVHAGANLSVADKAKMRNINKQLSVLQTTFQRKLLAASAAGALTVKDKSQLAGLSDNAIATAEQAAQARKDPGGYLLALQNTTQQPALTQLDDR